MDQLNGIMATLELKEWSPPKMDEAPSASSSRTLRKRIPTYPRKDQIKRRCNSIPKKNLQNPNVTNLESYYRNENFKPISVKSLETIYEEPLVKKSGAVLLVGPSKQRRIIFTGRATKEKLKKRKAKVKKSNGIKNLGPIKKGKRLTMDAFLLRLNKMMSTKNTSGSDNQDVLTSLISSTCKVAI